MLRRLLSLLLLVAAQWLASPVWAHEEEASPVRFVENKGQWESHILYTADLPGGRVYFEADQLTFDFCDYSQLHDRWFFRKPGESGEFPIDCHSFTLTFPRSNSQPNIVPHDPETWYHNYFIGNDHSKWASDVKVYHELRYENIFPGIDFVVYGKENSLKYDFVVHAGSNPGDVRMRFTGLDSLFLHKDELHFNTSVNKIIDAAPVSFQNGSEVATRYALEGNEVAFSFPNGYTSQSDLTIDPTLIFSTFTGSTANNFGFSATYDDAGNLLAGGIAYATGYPTTNGAYQTFFAGGFDVSISKFDDAGGHIWSTYIGGNAADQPHSMICNPNGDLFFMGRSNSNDYPVTPGGYSQNLAGGYDIIVTRLSSNGQTLMGSTYIGGSFDDGLNMTANYQSISVKYNYGDDARGEIFLDDLDNVYVAACTRSNDFPTTSGALSSTLGGSQDGCVFKMEPMLSNLTWSTYLGGSNDDAAYSVKVDANYQAYVVGGTRSTNFPTTPGTIAPNALGGIDGFITHLNDGGTGLVASTFIGTADYNQCYFVELDRDEDVYVVGQKKGAWQITPSTIWRTPNGGGQFLMKLNSDLNTVIYSTEFGTNNSAVNISPTAFLVDVCEFVYVSGWGGATNFEGFTTGLPVSANAYDATTTGSDLYILVLQPDIVGIEYATFIGGNQSAEHVDGGTSRFNKRAEIYQSVCAGCQGNSDWPTTPGAFSSTNNSGLCNLACFKLSLDLPGVVADFYPDPDTIGCAPQEIQFNNLSAGGNLYFWDFGDGGTSSDIHPIHIFQNPGTYEVQLIAIDSNTCNVVDTAYRTITVAPLPIATVTPDTSICEGESITLTATGGLSYQWQPPLFLNNPVAPTVTSTPTATITYNVIATGFANCRDTAQITVGVLPRPAAQAVGDTLICPGDSAAISASGGVSYDWFPNGGLANPNAASTLASPGGTTSYFVEVTGANGCTELDTVTVEVSPIDANAGPDSDLCIGDSLQLNGSGGSTFAWSPPTALNGTAISNPFASPTATITYTLVVTDQYGCIDEDSVEILVRPLPIVDAGSDELICDNDSVRLGASGAQTYSWFPPTNLSNPNSADPFAFPTGNVTYTVTGTDQFGCVNSDSLSIDVIPAPLAVAMGDAIICEDSTAQLSATGGITYSWAPGNVLDNASSATPVATLASSTQFVVTVFAANGCDDTDTVQVDVTPTPVVDIIGRPIICLGTFTTLEGTGADFYEWNTGETTPSIRIEPDSTTTYTLVGYVDGCPSLPEDFTLQVDRDLPTASFEVNPDSGWIPMITNFTNLSTNASSFDWDFGDGNGSNAIAPTHTYLDTGRFVIQLIAYNDNNCPDTTLRRVIVGADFSIFVPNAFTPNGDGVNDFWSTPWFGVQEFHVMLFDRWGMLIYESFDPNFKWDGFYKNDEAQEGVYTYVIEARGYVGEKVRRAGTVTLYR